MIQHGFDRDGGFIVLNTDKRLWWYAYATSIHANKAHKKPDAIAAEMAAHATFDQRLLATSGERALEYDDQYHRLYYTLNPLTIAD